jgi:hypothetical protein
MFWKRVALAAALAGTLAAAPFSGAQAQWRRHWHHGPGVWPFVAGAAVLGTAAALTAPYWARPYYYPPPPVYYAPPPPPAVYYYPGYSVGYRYW